MKVPNKKKQQRVHDFASTRLKLSKPCPNCGQSGAHFVYADGGFYICDTPDKPQ